MSADLTDERLTEWHEDVVQGRGHGLRESNRRILALIDTLRKERHWKAEALPVIEGLQELGRVLRLSLGVQITGPEATKAVSALIERAEKAERERDAWKRTADERSTVEAARQLAELRAKVKALAEEWDDTATWQGQTDALRALLGGEDR